MKLLCLTCWEPFQKADSPFVCTYAVNCTISANVAPSDVGFRGDATALAGVLQRYTGFQGVFPLATRFYAKSRLFRKRKVAQCLKCKMPTSLLGCPRCWHVLEIQDDGTEIIPTLLVGDTGTGKTVLTAAMTRELAGAAAPITGSVAGPFAWDLRTKIIPDLEQGQLPGGTMKKELAAFFEVSMRDGPLRHAFIPLRDYQGIAVQKVATQAVLQPDFRQA